MRIPRSRKFNLEETKSRDYGGCLAISVAFSKRMFWEIDQPLPNNMLDPTGASPGGE